MTTFSCEASQSAQRQFSQQGKVLVVLHREQSTPGRVGRILKGRGITLDIRRPPLGDPLPASLSDYEGAIIFGGPMSANDSYKWLREEIDWIQVPLKEEVPLLGICLGAQILARHLGGRVLACASGNPEIGYWPIIPTAAGRAYGTWPERVYQWHSEGFDNVVGMEKLAHGARFQNQAFKYGKCAFGVQFHPEVSFQTMCKWTSAANHKLGHPGAQERAAQIELGHRHDRSSALWLSTFLDKWLDSVRT